MIRFILIFLSLALPSQAQQYWDWQLSDPYDLNVDAQILIIEPDDLSAGDVAALKARGVMPYCYLSVGTWENYRDDADQFPADLLGNTLGNWPDERYLDIRRMDLVLPLMRKRIETCARKGFVGVEGDNIDAFENDNGLGLTLRDSLTYVRALAHIAHGLGMQYIQKNAPELVPDLVDELDFILVEECFQYRFCPDIAPYANAGKDVLAVEFFKSEQDWDQLCEQARELGFHLIIKTKDILPGGLVCN